MILSTPYLHVQAIRRRYRDEGRPTIAKPAVYAITLNLPTGAANEIVTNNVLIDSDSDFVWLHSYWYVQDAAWDPEIRSNGEVIGDVGTRELQMMIMSSGRTFSNTGHTPPAWFGWGAWPFGLNDTQSEMQDGPVANEGEFGLIPAYYPEPIIVKAGDRVSATLRCETAIATLGNLILMSGVRLFSGG